MNRGGIGRVSALLLLSGLFAGGLRVQNTTAEPARQAVMLFTGNTRGFLVSCGCDGKQPIGMGERASLIQSLKQRYPKALLLDIGALAEADWQADVVVEAMAVMGYDAVGVAPSDLALGKTYRHAVERHGLPVVGVPRPVRWFAIDGVSRPVAAPKDVRANELLVAVVCGCAMGEALRTLRGTLGGSGRQLDLLVCLGALGRADAIQSARDIIGARCGIVIADGGEDGPDQGAFGAAIVPSGRGVTVVQAKRQLDGCWELTARQVGLPDDVEPDLRVKAVIDRHYAKRQEMFIQGQMREIRAGRDEGHAVLAGTERGYVPGWGCRNCHEEAFSRWQASKHAGAIRTLADKSRLVPECIPCHSEEFRRTGKLSRGQAAQPEAGNQGSQDSPSEGGVECASCHGPGVLHAALGTRETAERGSLKGCVRCHDAERSPKFDAPKYWDAIRH